MTNTSRVGAGWLVLALPLTLAVVFFQRIFATFHFAKERDSDVRDLRACLYRATTWLAIRLYSAFVTKCLLSSSMELP
jgi:hypothetical protein